MHTRVGGSWKNVTEGYTRIGGAWKAFFTSVVPLNVEYLVIAGGGGGGTTGYNGGGGGGAGGYRTATGLSLTAGTSYTVTVGAGGNGGGSGSLGAGSNGASGSNSVFASITSAGGGGGGGGGTPIVNPGVAGGSGGGAAGGTGAGAGNTPSTSPSQGNNGGIGQSDGFSQSSAGGGGGAGAVGSNGTYGGTSIGYGGNGGAGVASSITGTSVTRGGGGGGSAATNASGSAGAGGAGGGGAATITASPATAGTVNTGGGGGGGNTTSGSGAGGSGIVIIKYPSNYAINPSAGLSHRTVTSAGFNITSFTAGTGTVTFANATTSSYELIQTVYLTASQSSVTLDVSGLSSDYQHLQIRATTRTNRSGADSDPIILRFNSDSGSNYTRHGLGGYNFGGTNAMYSNAATSQTSMMLSENMPVAGSTANAFGAFVTDILDPFETTKNKTVRTLNGMNAAWSSIEVRSGAWLSTTAVTSITILPLVGTQLAANSRFTIYGIKGI